MRAYSASGNHLHSKLERLWKYACPAFLWMTVKVSCQQWDWIDACKSTIQVVGAHSHSKKWAQHVWNITLNQVNSWTSMMQAHGFWARATCMCRISKPLQITYMYIWINRAPSYLVPQLELSQYILILVYKYTATTSLLGLHPHIAHSAPLPGRKLCNLRAPHSRRAAKILCSWFMNQVSSLSFPAT